MTRAAFIQDFARDPLARTVRLYIWRMADYGRSGEVLVSDGTWRTVAEGASAGDDAGLVLPADAVEAIAVAAQNFQGHASHADTEARILREWLAAERDRVERVLFPPEREP